MENLSFATYIPPELMSISDAQFPYVNILEAIPVIVSVQTYMNGNIVDKNTFAYGNAVYHRQGRGFRGFADTHSTNMRGQVTTRTYDVYGHSTLMSEKSPEFYNVYSYNTELGGNRVIQDFSYSFDPLTQNLKSRADNPRCLTETFEYDGLNRLVAYGPETASYDNKGNLTSRSDVGDFSYSMSSKPYAVTGVTRNDSRISPRQQEVTYTSFSRPSAISENSNVANFTYNSEFVRVKMEVKIGESPSTFSYYLGGCYEATTSSLANPIDLEPLDATTRDFGSIRREHLYFGGGYYDAPSVLIRNNSSEEVHYILRDYLGSITHVVNYSGQLVQELSYDAWGALRDPDTHEVYAPDEMPYLPLWRGYTGHEHLTRFGLVNMNARLYDPVVGRFLSPDPLVQMPDMTQNFNRYSYCLNNPLCYVDEDGEFWWIAVGALIGGVSNLIYKGVSGQLNNAGDWIAAFGIGAIAGAAGGCIGGLGSAAVAAGSAGGFFSGFVGGGIGGLIEMTALSELNHAAFGDAKMSTKSILIGAAANAILCGAINGGVALKEGRNFWYGDNIQSGRNAFSIKNSPLNNNLQINESSSTSTLHVDDVADRLKDHLVERKYGQEFNAIIENESQKLHVRVETRSKLDRVFPELNLNKNDLVRHMNIQYFEKNTMGYWDKIILPNQKSHNVHIFLNNVKP